MRRHMIEIALMGLTASSAVAQQNIPCPDYTTEVNRIDRNNALAARGVRLCLDDREIQPALTSVPRIKRNPAESARRELDFGVAAAKEGLQEKALQHFVAAVQIDAYYWGGVAHLGSALVRVWQSSQALEFLLRAMQIAPQGSQYSRQYGLGNALIG
jgi:tetratricopeptide (TPR) repeat protein